MHAVDAAACERGGSLALTTLGKADTKHVVASRLAPTQTDRLQAGTMTIIQVQSPLEGGGRRNEGRLPSTCT